MGAAPPEKARSASAMSETVQELGLALGVATLGSLATAVYRARVDGQLPAGTPPEVADTAADSLAGVSAIADQMPAGWLDQAKQAATTGLQVAMLVAAVSTLVLAFLSAVVLLHVGTIGADEWEGDEADAAEPAGQKAEQGA